jgi:predicted DNA-binding protein (MmcQ/YjbR family)
MLLAQRAEVFEVRPTGIGSVMVPLAVISDHGCVTRASLDDQDLEALRRIRDICASFIEADEGELQDRPLFRVGRRRFAIFNGAGSPPRPRWAGCGRSLHFLADEVEIDALLRDRRFATSPHHGDRRWMFLRLDVVSVDWAEVSELLDAAYRQVAPRSQR